MTRAALCVMALVAGCDYAFQLERPPPTSPCAELDPERTAFCADFDGADPLAVFAPLDPGDYATLVGDAHSAPHAAQFDVVGGPSADGRLSRIVSGVTSPFEVATWIQLVAMDAPVTSAKIVTIDLGDRLLYLYSDGLIRERVMEATPPITRPIGQVVPLEPGQWTRLGLSVDLATSFVDVKVGDRPPEAFAFTSVASGMPAIIVNIGPHDPLPGTALVAITARYDDVYVISN